MLYAITPRVLYAKAILYTITSIILYAIVVLYAIPSAILNDALPNDPSLLGVIEYNVNNILPLLHTL